MVTVFVTPQALKDLKSLPEKDQKKIKKRLKYLEQDIYAGKKLAGKLNDLYSLRAWPYRIFYIISDKEIWIAHIDHRQSAYKK